MLSDLLFIFCSTIVSSSEFHYDRILILSFFVLHLTESYFGRRHAILALLAVVTGYVSMVATLIQRGSVLSWSEELWSVGLFTIAAVVFITQYGGFQRRLELITELFESAEEGDFTKAYDANADKTPDAITRVGRAYNRVRLQLASMVLTDPLTGCLNRRGLDQALAREIARSTRAGSELSLLALDLDHFKNINDSFGHIAGDVVLREFGALLVQTARAGDMVARTGGEEFSILLPDTDPAGAYRAGVRLCDAVRIHPFMVNGKRARHHQRRRVYKRLGARCGGCQHEGTRRRGTVRRQARWARPRARVERRARGARSGYQRNLMQPERGAPRKSRMANPRFTTSVSVGFETLRSNPLRTILSTLGIVIGTAALVSVLSVGDGMERLIRQQVASTTDLQRLAVTPRMFRIIEGTPFPQPNPARFTVADAELLRAALGDSATVNMTTGGSALVTSAKDTTPHPAQITGLLRAEQVTRTRCSAARVHPRSRAARWRSSLPVGERRRQGRAEGGCYDTLFFRDNR